MIRSTCLSWKEHFAEEVHATEEPLDSAEQSRRQSLVMNLWSLKESMKVSEKGEVEVRTASSTLEVKARGVMRNKFHLPGLFISNTSCLQAFGDDVRISESGECFASCYLANSPDQGRGKREVLPK